MARYFIWMGATPDVIRFEGPEGFEQEDAAAYMKKNYPDRRHDAWGWSTDDPSIPFEAAHPGTNVIEDAPAA